MAVKREKAETYEGHGDSSKVEGVRKGTYLQVGSVVPLSHAAVSVNQKTGHEGSGKGGA
jgi:hypothetical protein